MPLSSLLTTIPMFARMIGRVPTAHLWYLLKRMRNEKPHRFAGQTRINSFFPPYPSPAFDRFCQAVIDRRRVPYSTYLALTDLCPYKCEHCSYANRNAPGITHRQMLDTIAQIKNLGTCTLGLTGGEPLLYDPIEDLISAAQPEMTTILFTTGHTLDNHKAKQLASAKIDCVTIGLESADPTLHDQRRQSSGSFNEAQQAAHACHEAGIYTAISTMATAEKIENGELEALYNLAAKWNAGEFRILAPVATGAWAGCSAARLSDQQRRSLQQFHVTRNRHLHGPAIASFAYLESEELFGCGAGYHHLFIDAAGNVCPCDLTPLSFGNVTTEPLSNIWQRMENIFPLPRRTCLMSNLNICTTNESPELPLPPEQSTKLCPPRDPNEPLPEGYKRLL